MNKKFVFGHIAVEVTSTLPDVVIRSLHGYYLSLMDSVKLHYATDDEQLISFVRFVVVDMHYSIEVTHVCPDYSYLAENV